MSGFILGGIIAGILATLPLIWDDVAYLKPFVPAVPAFAVVALAVGSDSYQNEMLVGTLTGLATSGIVLWLNMYGSPVFRGK